MTSFRNCAMSAHDISVRVPIMSVLFVSGHTGDDVVIGSPDE